MRLHLGAGVFGPEGEICVLADLVVDPASHRVTHLVVEPRHHPTLARLVPIELAYGRAVIIPKGEAELRRGSLVTTADGQRVGGVAGLLADDDDRITAWRCAAAGSTGQGS